MRGSTSCRSPDSRTITERQETFRAAIARLRAFPTPGVFDNRSQISVAGRPAEFFLGTICIGYQSGGIARAPGLHLDRYPMSGNLRCGIDDLLYGKSRTVSQVESIATAAGHEMLNGQPVGAAQILDMDVVPNAGSVRRVVEGRPGIMKNSPKIAYSSELKSEF